MWGCFDNPFVNDTSLDARPLPSLHMRRRYSALTVQTNASYNLDPRALLRMTAREGSTRFENDAGYILDVWDGQSIFKIRHNWRKSRWIKSSIQNKDRSIFKLRRNLSDANYPTDKPSQTYNPSLVWIQIVFNWGCVPFSKTFFGFRQSRLFRFSY